MKSKLSCKLLVSVVLPTKNSEMFLDSCLKSLKNQTYKNIEIIIVDNHSTDNTLVIAHRYTKNIIMVDQKKQFNGLFSATYQRNLGVAHSRGDVVYYIDADMELNSGVISECVAILQQNKAQAVIIPEDSVGSTFWARCKGLERRCYWGDNSIEAPRCLLKSTWNNVGGLDETVGGGGDDWDLREKLNDNNYVISRTVSICIHHEGALTLGKLIRKRFLYGKESLKYIKKRKNLAISHYFPIRMAYIRNWNLFVLHPILGIGTIIMRIVEYCAGGSGILYNKLKTYE